MIMYIAVGLASFILGAVSFMKEPCDNKYKITLKKHKDIVNWLKSELKETSNNKLTKRIDSNKVKLLEILIQRLEK